MSEEIILGIYPEKDKKLKGKIVWFNGQAIGKPHIFREGIARIEGVDISSRYGERIYIKMIVDLSKKNKHLFNATDWELHKGDKVKSLNKREAFLYML